MLNVTAGYGWLSDLNAFIWEFSNIITYFKHIFSSNFNKCVCLGLSRSVAVESKPF